MIYDPSAAIGGKISGRRKVMDASLISLLISLVSGAAGGNIAGALFKNLNLGTLWNSVSGILGGGIGAKVLGALIPALAVGSGGLDLGSILGQVAGGGVGGGILMAIVGFIRKAMSK
jgi:hypothetical protein